MERMLERGYASIVNPCSPALVEQVMDGFKRMLDLPAEERRLWCFDIAGDGDPDIGLIDATKKSVGGREQKWYFHYPGHASLYPLLRLRKVLLRDWQEQWLVQLERLKVQLDDDMLNFCQELDRRIPDVGFVRRFVWHRGCHVVRLLAYIGQREGFTAKRHLDRDAITTAWYDSLPGLVVDGVPIESTPERAYRFFGTQACELTGGVRNGLLTPAPHSVRATPEWEVEGVRYAGVYFAQLMSIPSRELLAAYGAAFL